MELDFTLQLAFQKSWWGQNGPSLPLPPHPPVVQHFVHLQTRLTRQLLAVKGRTAVGIPAPSFMNSWISVISKYITVSTHLYPPSKSPEIGLPTHSSFLKVKWAFWKKLVIFYCVWILSFPWTDEWYVSISLSKEERNISISKMYMHTFV